MYFLKELIHKYYGLLGLTWEERKLFYFIIKKLLNLKVVLSIKKGGGTNLYSFGPIFGGN